MDLDIARRTGIRLGALDTIVVAALHLKEINFLLSLPCAFLILDFDRQSGQSCSISNSLENWTMHPSRTITASRPSAPSRGT